MKLISIDLPQTQSAKPASPFAGSTRVCRVFDRFGHSIFTPGELYKVHPDYLLIVPKSRFISRFISTMSQKVINEAY